MSLFDELDTPEAQRPEPRPRRLAELSLRVHSTNWNEGNGAVRLLAEATTAFDDATAGDGVQVGFFLNGRRVADVASDEYGLALLDEDLSAELFHDGNNELVVRVKGLPCSASQAFPVEMPKLPLPATIPQGCQLKSIALVVHKCVDDPETSTASLHAEAKTVFEGNEVLENVSVTFFLNGERLADVGTDEFAIAVLKTQFPRTQLRSKHNALVARVKGYSLESIFQFESETRGIRIERFGWQWLDGKGERGGIVFRIHAAPANDECLLTGTDVRIMSTAKLGGRDCTLGASKLDSNGRCEIHSELCNRRREEDFDGGDDCEFDYDGEQDPYNLGCCDTKIRCVFAHGPQVFMVADLPYVGGQQEG